LKNDRDLSGSGRFQADKIRNDVKKCERDDSQTQSKKDPFQLSFYDKVRGFEPVLENDDENGQREQSKKCETHSLQKVLNSKHKCIVAGLNKGEVKKRMGKKDYSAGQVQVIVEGWFFFQNFFSYGKNEEKVQKQRRKGQKCDLIQPKKEAV
jgi:hypothetical protein